MKNQLAITTLALFSLAFVGCGGGITQVSARRYPAVPIAKVQVLYQEPTRPYETIAFLHSGHSWEMSGRADVADMQEKAGHVGADAIIVTSVHGVTLTEYDDANGKAIKWLR